MIVLYGSEEFFAFVSVFTFLRTKRAAWCIIPVTIPTVIRLAGCGGHDYSIPTRLAQDLKTLLYVSMSTRQLKDYGGAILSLRRLLRSSPYSAYTTPSFRRPA
jgi:hypothetical protein